MGGFTLSNANENRFCLNDSMLFLSATTDTTSFLKITLRHPSEQVQLGKVVKEKTKTRTIMLKKDIFFIIKMDIYIQYQETILI